jgi:hypothetical protein
MDTNFVDQYRALPLHQTVLIPLPLQEDAVKYVKMVNIVKPVFSDHLSYVTNTYWLYIVWG